MADTHLELTHDDPVIIELRSKLTMFVEHELKPVREHFEHLFRQIPEHDPTLRLLRSKLASLQATLKDAENKYASMRPPLTTIADLVRRHGRYPSFNMDMRGAASHIKIVVRPAFDRLRAMGLIQLLAQVTSIAAVTEASVFRSALAQIEKKQRDFVLEQTRASEEAAIQIRREIDANTDPLARFEREAEEYFREVERELAAR